MDTIHKLEKQVTKYQTQAKAYNTKNVEYEARIKELEQVLKSFLISSFQTSFTNK